MIMINIYISLVIVVTHGSEVLGELALVQIVEVRVLHCHAARYPFVGLERHHARKQVQSVLLKVLRVLRHRDPLPLRERRLEVRQLEGRRPVCLIRCPLYLEDFENLVDL